ncbi:MAG: hypothetical protein RIB80_12485 [Rhodospirillales bacterium]
MINNSQQIYQFIHRQVDISELESPQFLSIRQIWDGLRNGSFAPSWSVGDMLRYPVAAIPFFTVVQVMEDGPKTFKYLFWGTGHVDVKGFDYTGRSPVDHQPEEHGQAVDREFRMVVDQKQPLAFLHDIRPQVDQTSLFQECLRLPLSNDGAQVTHVLSYSDWQTENQKWKRLFKTA